MSFCFPAGIFDLQRKTTSGDVAYTTAESNTLKTLCKTVGILLIADLYADTKALQVWRPPCWICREFKHHLL